MKLARSPLFQVFLLAVVALGFASFVTISACSTVQKVVTSVNNPDGSVGAVVADCVKPEISNQVANLLGQVNAIALDPSKTKQIKNDEIAALEASGKEALACAVREGITQVTTLIQNAAKAHASIDPRVADEKALLEDVLFSRGYSYSDGWRGYGTVGGAGGAAGVGGAGGA